MTELIQPPVDLSHHLAAYLETVLGEPVSLEPIASDRLPLYLGHSYRLERARLFGADLVFALAVHDDQDVTAIRLSADLKALANEVGPWHVVLVLRRLSSHARTRLIQAGLPFVVPHRQMFLPMLLVDLRERFPREREESGPSLSWAAQLVLLRHVLWRDVEAVPLGLVARTCHYSAMTLTNVRAELVAAGACADASHGRSKWLVFIGDRRAIWERMLPNLRSPVRRTYPVSWISSDIDTWTAGISALATDTMLAPDRLPTVALDHREVRRALERGAVVGCPSADGAALMLEAWMYDPRRLAKSSAVDPLSLYLSLQSDPDVRVQTALHERLEHVSW
jgi:hypothetical protein